MLFRSPQELQQIKGMGGKNIFALRFIQGVARRYLKQPGSSWIWGHGPRPGCWPRTRTLEPQGTGRHHLFRDRSSSSLPRTSTRPVVRWLQQSGQQPQGGRDVHGGVAAMDGQVEAEEALDLPLGHVLGAALDQMLGAGKPEAQ